MTILGEDSTDTGAIPQEIKCLSIHLFKVSDFALPPMSFPLCSVDEYWHVPHVGPLLLMYSLDECNITCT